MPDRIVELMIGKSFLTVGASLGAIGLGFLGQEPGAWMLVITAFASLIKGIHKYITEYSQLQEKHKQEMRHKEELHQIHKLAQEQLLLGGPKEE